MIKVMIGCFICLLLWGQSWAAEKNDNSVVPAVKIHYKSYRLLTTAAYDSGYASVVIVFDPDATILYMHSHEDAPELEGGHLDACSYLRPSAINNFRRAGVASAQLTDQINRAPPEQVNSEMARKVVAMARVNIVFAENIQNKPVALCRNIEDIKEEARNKG